MFMSFVFGKMALGAVGIFLFSHWCCFYISTVLDLEF